ncbi:unnamed protein product [Acanthosepion pharaonis]|uniref:Uncharacterized protein n=1 Tax=Acanthosepion pharaonis TaxID=158019 RepID=A0A812C2N3_ACAPH|nr:unnamed protein product [Sepia pharaonis]
MVQYPLTHTLSSPFFYAFFCSLSLSLFFLLSLSPPLYLSIPLSSRKPIRQIARQNERRDSGGHFINIFLSSFLSHQNIYPFFSSVLTYFFLSLFLSYPNISPFYLRFSFFLIQIYFLLISFSFSFFLIQIHLLFIYLILSYLNIFPFHLPSFFFLSFFHKYLFSCYLTYLSLKNIFLFLTNISTSFFFI